MKKLEFHSETFIFFCFHILLGQSEKCKRIHSTLSVHKTVMSECGLDNRYLLTHLSRT